MFDNLRARMALALLPRKANGQVLNPTSVLSSLTPGVPVYTGMSVRKATRDGYKMSVYVYRCVRIIVQAASAIPWVIQDMDGELIPNHPLGEVLRNPNPNFSGQDMMELLIAHSQLVGNALWMPVMVNGKPKEFWPVMPDLVRPIPSDVPGEWLAGWKVYNRGGAESELPPETFIHFMQLDPGNLFWGTSPLLAAARTIDTDNEAQDTQKVSMQNRANPDGVFTHESIMNPEQFEEARRQIRENFLQKSKRREPWVLGAGAKWQQMSMTPIEMDFIASRLANKRDIAAAFGISPIFLGDLEQSSYNNMVEARKALYEDVIIPLLDDVKSTLNLTIAPMYGDIVISYDTSKVAALRPDFSAKVDQAQKLWGMGVPFLQINERLEMGFEQFPGWASGYLPMQLVPTGSTPQPKPIEDEPEDEPDEDDEKAIPSGLAAAVPWLEEVRDRVKQIELSGLPKKCMAPQDWEDAYANGPPHWAVDLTPSLFAQEFVTEMADRKMKSVLEIGCGNGRDSIFFARAGLDVTAIDVAEGAVKLAKENAEEAEVEIDFHVGNAESLPFEDKQFGAMFSLSVLHATDLAKSIPEVARVLQRHGIAFIYYYADTQWADGTEEGNLRINDYLDLVRASGFEVLSVYGEREEEFDEYGERHLVVVSLLRKE